ncbi:4-(cytidine 5'-diphospho)-2-C-methyl-D-erythritol kinase [soil metagenome]
MAIKSLYDVPAPAKLNLFLHVVGRRPDGYHLLQSVFVLIDWCDTLHFESRTDGVISRVDLGAPLPQDDLCLRAAKSLQQASGTNLGAVISIEKRVPSGAGMGGGSSDAASTLLALNRLWGLGWSLPELLPLGLKLGADVPFFLHGKNAWVEGIGEQITPIDVPVQRFAVIKPSSSVMTQDIFTSPLLVRNTAPAIVAGFSAGAQGADGRFFGRNDLQPPAMSVCTEIGQAADLLERAFGNSRMTGSGSAVFAWADAGSNAICKPDGEPDSKSVKELNTGAWPPELAPGWVSRMCSSLPEHPLFGWARKLDKQD